MLTIVGLLTVGIIVLGLCVSQGKASDKEVRFWMNTFDHEAGSFDD